MSHHKTGVSLRGAICMPAEWILYSAPVPSGAFLAACKYTMCSFHMDWINPDNIIRWSFYNINIGIGIFACIEDACYACGLYSEYPPVCFHTLHLLTVPMVMAFLRWWHGYACMHQICIVWECLHWICMCMCRNILCFCSFSKVLLGCLRWWHRNACMHLICIFVHIIMHCMARALCMCNVCALRKHVYAFVCFAFAVFPWCWAVWGGGMACS